MFLLLPRLPFVPCLVFLFFHIFVTEFCQSFNVPFVSLMCPFIVLSHNEHTTNRASIVSIVKYDYIWYLQSTPDLRSEMTTFHGHKEESTPMLAQLKTIMFNCSAVWSLRLISDCPSDPRKNQHRNVYGLYGIANCYQIESIS